MNDSDTSIVRSARLDLVLLSPEVLRLSLSRDDEEVERILQLTVPPEWYAESGLLRFRLEQLAAEPDYLPWSLRAIALRDRRLMVGYINCHTKPADPYLRPFSTHGVEFGFEIFPPHRRRSYAQEACTALMQWAHEHHGVPEFLLSISPENRPSLRLAERLGFTRVGSRIDEIDGPEDVFKHLYTGTDTA